MNACRARVGHARPTRALSKKRGGGGAPNASDSPPTREEGARSLRRRGRLNARAAREPLRRQLASPATLPASGAPRRANARRRRSLAAIERLRRGGLRAAQLGRACVAQAPERAPRAPMRYGCRCACGPQCSRAQRPAQSLSPPIARGEGSQRGAPPPQSPRAPSSAQQRAQRVAPPTLLKRAPRRTPTRTRPASSAASRM